MAGTRQQRRQPHETIIVASIIALQLGNPEDFQSLQCICSLAGPCRQAPHQLVV
jgi:hypothetical protein